MSNGQRDPLVGRELVCGEHIPKCSHLAQSVNCSSFPRGGDAAPAPPPGCTHTRERTALAATRAT